MRIGSILDLKQDWMVGLSVPARADIDVPSSARDQRRVSGTRQQKKEQVLQTSHAWQHVRIFALDTAAPF